MSLVGDLIMELRQRIPDAPMAFTSTGTPAIIGTTDPNGSFPPSPPDYFFRVSQATQWGESNASPEIPVLLTPGQNAFQIQWANVPTIISGNAVMKVYFGIFSNSYQTYYSIPFVGGVGNYTITGVNPQVGSPPTRTTCFLPDTDGNFIGAFTAYRLLNRALQEMVRIAGGIIDVTGVQSQINQSMYRLDSPFYQFINAWFDGYPMDVVPRSMMYLRNSAAGFSGILSYEQDGPQSVIQVWPQSNRSGGGGTLSQPMDTDDQSFTVSNAVNFLSIGLARIDDEVVVYSQASTPPGAPFTTFSGVTRGMGGTDITAHAFGAPVTELNIRMSGYRMAREYNVGDATLIIQVPQAWETPLVLHMLSQVRSMEQDEAASKQLLGDFVQMADKISKQSRMGKLKPRQIPIWGQNSTDARNVNGIGFGWLIN